MSETKVFDGMHFPAHEVHMIEWMRNRNERIDGRLTYQHHKFLAAMRYVKQFRAAIDVGGHVGMWSMHLVNRFDYVFAFEPVAVHRACFERNVFNPAGYRLLPYALGEEDGKTVYMHSEPGSSGNTTVAESGTEPVTMRRLDDVLREYHASDDPALWQIDFMKLDCEGYELFALRGGERMLRACKPAIIVEQKPGKAQAFSLGERDAVAYLKGLGATLRQEIGGDFIMNWETT